MADKITSNYSVPNNPANSAAPKSDNNQQKTEISEKAQKALLYLASLSAKLDQNSKEFEKTEFKSALSAAFMVLAKNTSSPVAKALLESDKTQINPRIREFAKEFFAKIPEDLAKAPRGDSSLPTDPAEREKMIKGSEEFKVINSMDKKVDDALLGHELLGPLHSLLNKGFTKNEVQSAAVGSIKGDQRLFDAMNVVFARIEAQAEQDKEAVKEKMMAQAEKDLSRSPLEKLLAPIKAIFKFITSLLSGKK